MLSEMIRLVMVFLGIALGLTLAGAAERENPEEASTFVNPIVERGADPWIVVKDDWYWFTATRGNRIDVLKSQTLAGLGSAEAVTIWRAPSSGPMSRSIWAPEFHWMEGRWYVYFTATDESGSDSNRRIYALESATEDLQGEFIEKGKVASPSDEYAIDGTVFRHTDGRLYFLWSGRERSESGPQNIYIAPMRNPWTIDGPRVLLSTPEHEWEKHGWAVNEGPEVLQRSGKTFVVYSGSGYLTPHYALGLLTNETGDLLDANGWSKSAKPVFASYEGDEGKVYGPGHNGFFRSRDGTEDWIVYHAWDAPVTIERHRSARAQRFCWSEEGWPVFGRPIPPGVPIPVPAGE